MPGLDQRPSQRITAGFSLVAALAGGCAAAGLESALVVADSPRPTAVVPSVPSAPSPTLPNEPALVSARWGTADGGRSLIVTPSAWVRLVGIDALQVLWAEVTTLQPDADSPGMRDQLACHLIGAPDKPTWNLEPWRPDVGLVATLAALCNP